MKVWNTAVPVVANVLADDPDDAYRRLTRALTAAGFEPYDDPECRAGRAPLTRPFEAEAGTEADL